MLGRNRRGRGMGGAEAADPPGVGVEEVTTELVFKQDSPICAPLQQKLSDVHVLKFNLGAKKFEAEYDRVIKAINKRARKIAPGLYMNKPITPIPNPQNCPKPYNHDDRTKWGHSYYTVEMRFHSENPHEYRGLRVQIIFRDYDGYMLGFRVRTNGRLTKWYYCSNKEFPIPFFIQEDATKLPFREDYVMKPLIGGAATFMNIFKQFSQYPEVRNTEDITAAFLSAVVVLSEARRIIWVFREVKDRIRRNEAPSDLDCKVPGMELPTGLAWASLGNWSMDCKQVLNSAFKGEYRPRTGAKFAETVAPVKTFGQLISQDEESGHLSLLMRVEKIAAPEGGWVLTRLKKKANNPGLEVVDPGFPDDPVLPDDE
ncbi:hypothetical protein ZWY2020_026401 [Hordeum vulgare]|nr:hypothetical protein ZWY2020_026401 [Hordeum vulgare]